MSRLLRYIAVLLIYLMTPAAEEIAENLVHLATAGHFAHALEDSAHDNDNREHGCSGIVHVCACHSSPSFIPVDGSVDVEMPAIDEVDLGWADARPVADGHPHGVFRPPMV